MASETQAQPRHLAHGLVWPPDDTEESVLGTDLHQGTITDLRLGFNEAARTGLGRGESARWRAFSQMALLGCLRPDGSSYRTYLDVFVYQRPIDPARGSLSVWLDGPPAVIVEVLSEATYDVDLDLARGKGYSYARAGVPEYLALDPTGAILPEGGRAWRLADGVYRLWEPDAEGRWQSAMLPVAVGLEGLRAAVFTRDGQRMLREDEIAEERAHAREVEAELARLRRLLAERGGQV